VARGRELARGYNGRLAVLEGRFSDMERLLADEGVTAVDGIAFDLGVSSMQIDQAERGFSFRFDGPLDMRMGTDGPTAADIVNGEDEGDLADIIYEFGEERFSRRIARAIKEAAPRTTAALAQAVLRGMPARDARERIHPATRTFQALRIAVNRELDELDRFLAFFPDLLKPGGRCVVISFHSLEDRLVKRRFRDLAWTSSLPPALAKQAGERVEAVCTPVSRKAVFADDAETDDNPRARSARLRACARTAAPNLPAHAGVAPPGSRR
jgi:16S rRNA (cytosine1402-N4)-methyltransferase